ncbi:MAG: hypothetical protein P8I04_03100 [Algibacter sp.]|uniref:hypothetical protein n=1 Tax=Algibacter sp. TaxID=1872428 RepID=UPI00260C6001|nr:hypothetical protein [Algibacter sp.]MDG1728845.1 hypothetical protein [Algibacter sp.]
MISKEKRKLIKKYQLEMKRWQRKILITVFSISVINCLLLSIFFFGSVLPTTAASPYFIFTIITLISSPSIYYLRFCIREYRISNACRNSLKLNNFVFRKDENKLPRTNAA